MKNRRTFLKRIEKRKSVDTVTFTFTDGRDRSEIIDARRNGDLWLVGEEKFPSLQAIVERTRTRLLKEWA